MTAPSPRLSPTAGLFNALVTLAIRLLGIREIELEAQLAKATAEHQRLTTQTQGEAQ